MFAHADIQRGRTTASAGVPVAEFSAVTAAGGAHAGSGAQSADAHTHEAVCTDTKSL